MKNRAHFRTAAAAMILLLGAGAAGAQEKAGGGARRPNFVLIFADDLGWKDMGYNGSDFHETPNLDRLAREGMVFASGYAAAGNCVPSRACLLSGQYTPRHALYAVGSTRRGPENLMRMVPVPNVVRLPAENVTVAEALESAGYATGIFGKWHLGNQPGSVPGDQGFDAAMDANHPGSGARDDPKGADSITRAACAFIDANKDRPFFAFISHHAIHTPLQARPETLKRFEEKKAGEQHRDPLYAACLFDLDAAAGAVLKKLSDLGLDRSTLVVFTSDNGATGKSSQEPLRGAKGGYYEGGIRVPFIARWPGVIAPGSRSDAPVINVDLYPTFLAAAGAAAPAGKTLDGESLLPLLRGEGSLERAAIFWHFPGYLDNPVPRGRDPVFRTRPVSVIRKGSWKLHLYHEEWRLDGGRGKIDTSRAVELYDLAADIGERRDLALERKDRRDELLDDLLAWIDRAGAPLPAEPNPAYDPAAGGGKTGGKKKRNKESER